MYEQKYNPILSRKLFLLRVLRHFLIALLLIIIVLTIGIMGYRYYENLSWLDAYVNASMILSSMGQVNPLATPHGKFFAGTYALFCGLIFPVIIGIIIAPLLHRFLHQFHVDTLKK